MYPHNPIDRRSFLKSSALAGSAVLAARYLPFEGTVQANPAPLTTRSQVAVTYGSDHVDNIFRVMQTLKKQIAAAIGNRPVLIKTNHVSGGGTPLADTPPECVEGILEFLKSIGKTDVTVAEGSIGNPPLLAMQKMGYPNLQKKYSVRFKSLAEEGYTWMKVWNWDKSQTDLVQDVRVSKMLLNKNYFVISACRPKAHDRVVATLSLKNIIMGSIIVDGSTFNSGGGSSDKGNMHAAKVPSSQGGTGINRPYPDGIAAHTTQNNHQDLNDTICMLSNLLAPNMSVIDAYQGMQKNGPISGIPADPQQTAIASLDFLSADRIATVLMDVHNSVVNISNTLSADGDVADNKYSPYTYTTYNWPKYPACLNYCAQSGLGQYDTSFIDLVGDVTSLANLTPLVKTFILHDNTVLGYSLWMRPSPRVAPIGIDRRLG
jgi:uncharacterized protein (DUF362 family)